MMIIVHTISRARAEATGRGTSGLMKVDTERQREKARAIMVFDGISQADILEGKPSEKRVMGTLTASRDDLRPEVLAALDALTGLPVAAQTTRAQEWSALMGLFD
jgi:hypothetical protein